MVQAIKIQKFGGAEELQLVDIQLPKLQANEVLVKNLSIGLNYIDVYHRTGLYPIPLPSGIGLEACGLVEEIGSNVTLLKWETELPILLCRSALIQKNKYFLKKN